MARRHESHHFRLVNISLNEAWSGRHDLSLHHGGILSMALDLYSSAMRRDGETGSQLRLLFSIESNEEERGDRLGSLHVNGILERALRNATEQVDSPLQLPSRKRPTL